MATRDTASTVAVPPDLLEHIAVRVPCPACGRHYDVSLRDVVLSQQMVHEGCPVCSETECLPLTYSALADEAAVRALEASWSRLVQRVETAGFELTIGHPRLTH